jgi:SAM-dependent methyltransferase
MSLWVSGFLGAAAVVFLVKMAYVASVAVTIGNTGGALYVSTPRRRIRAVLDSLPISPGQVLIDLGCGDGRMLRAARKRCRVRAIGYEINPMAYLKARFLCFGHGVEIRRRNFWNDAIEGADVVFCYLFPDVMGKLSQKLRAEGKPGAVVISFNFPIPGLCPERTLRPRGRRQNEPVYFYRIPDAEIPEKA